MNGQALIWWTNLLGSQQPPVTVPDIQAAFFAKYRYRKTRSQLKSELNQCKYQPGQSNIQIRERLHQGFQSADSIHVINLITSGLFTVNAMFIN